MKLIYAILAGFIVMAILDILWFGFIFRSYWENHIHVTGQQNDLFDSVADLLLAVLLAIIYPMGYKGGSVFKEGARFGILAGLVASMPSALHIYAGGMWSLHIAAVIILNGIVVCGITGIVIARVYGKGKAAAKTT